MHLEVILQSILRIFNTWIIINFQILKRLKSFLKIITKRTLKQVIEFSNMMINKIPRYEIKNDFESNCCPLQNLHHPRLSTSLSHSAALSTGRGFTAATLHDKRWVDGRSDDSSPAPAPAHMYSVGFLCYRILSTK